MLFGGMMVRRVEAEQLLRPPKSIEAALLGARLVARFVADRIRYRRGMRSPVYYAFGNDMQSVMGGEYPGPGTQLGQGMTFAYLAALHAVHEGKLHDRERYEQGQRPRALA